MRALGVGDTGRHPHLPNVPPIADAVPGFNEDAWVGMMAPAGTPRVAIERFGTEISKLLASPEWRKVYADQGMMVQGSSPGGTTRKTSPTSIRFGLSIWFQRARSRQFWPWSRAMRTSVSPR